MTLLFQCNRFAVFEPLDDGEAVALDNMQPQSIIYYLQFNHALFQSVNWRERMIMICSNEPLQFLPPSIPYKKCLAEVIGRFDNTVDSEESDLELTPEELDCISELPAGWDLETLRGFRGYRSKPLPPISYPMRRLNWYLGAPLPQDAESTLWIHPARNRPLTVPEWDAIQANSGDAALLAWLGSVPTLAAVPNGPETPFPVPCEGFRGVIDWRQRSQFPALRVFDYAGNRKSERLFNIGSDGKPRVDWQLIQRQQTGTITHD